MGKTYAEKLAELRTDTDRSQKDVAALLGITQQQYHLYESGKREMPVKLIVQLCLLYRVSADYVLGLPKGLDSPR